VKTMWPLYGPIAGGTRVTITGQSLDAVTDVLFGEHRQNPDTSRLLFSSFNSNGFCYDLCDAQGFSEGVSGAQSLLRLRPPASTLS